MAGIGFFWHLALVLPVPFPHDFISCPSRRPVAVTIAQRAIDDRGKEYHRSKEIHGFESHRILPNSCCISGCAFNRSSPCTCTVDTVAPRPDWPEDAAAIFALG